MMYAVSYHGSGGFIHGEDSFDLLLDLEKADDLVIVNSNSSVIFSTPMGILNEIITGGSQQYLVNSASYYVPFPLALIDLNQDGISDFAIGGRLALSTDEGGFELISDSRFDGQEVAFVKNAGVPAMLVGKGNVIEVYQLKSGDLQKIGRIDLPHALASNRAYSFLPISDALISNESLSIIVLGDSSASFLVVDHNWNTETVFSLSAFQPGEVVVGSLGDFTRDGTSDVWVAEQRWKDIDGETVGRAVLLSSQLVQEALRGERTVRKIEDFASTILYGSRKYTDYDGIGASLSPVAGDITGDGYPDLSIPGHRHMSEAGALFVLPGKDLVPGSMSVEDDVVIRIAGRPVSQIAPPFIHWDATDINSDGHSDIILPVDNDLCSGLNAGAIYILSGRAIAARGLASRGLTTP